MARFYLHRGLQIRGKHLQNLANHGFLLLRRQLAQSDEFLPLFAGRFRGQTIERAAHGAERLGKIVNDAVQQDFFFLNFALQFFMLQQGVACTLQDLHLFAVLAMGAAQRQQLFTLGKNSGRLKWNLASRRRALNPDLRTAFGGVRSSPAVLRFRQKCFQERRFLRERNCRRTALCCTPQLDEPLGGLA